MDLFKKMQDELNENNKRKNDRIDDFVNAFEKCTETMNIANDLLNSQNVNNAVVMLSMCESKADGKNVVRGGLMGKKSDISEILAKAMENDEDFRDLIIKSVSDYYNSGDNLKSILPEGVDIDELKENIREQIGIKKSPFEDKTGLDDFNDNLDEFLNEDY